MGDDLLREYILKNIADYDYNPYPLCYDGMAKRKSPQEIVKDLEKSLEKAKIHAAIVEKVSHSFDFLSKDDWIYLKPFIPRPYSDWTTIGYPLYSTYSEDKAETSKSILEKAEIKAGIIRQWEDMMKFIDQKILESK